MKKILFIYAIICLNSSCKIGQSYEENIIDTESNSYKLSLKPSLGSSYYYNILNKSEVEMEVNGSKTNIINKSEVEINYVIVKDTGNNFLLKMKYDKINIYSDNGETKTKIDSENALATDDPVEKALGALKDAAITATITPLGDVTSIHGYDELGDRIIGSFSLMDESTKAVAKFKWQKMVEEGLIKKNLQQLFSIFPDSTIHVGDKWKTDSKEGSEISFDVRTFFTLKEIDNDIALIEAQARIKSDSAVVDLSGTSVLADLKGKQQGEFEIEKSTGMMLSSKTISEVEGTMMIMGRDIPVVIKNTVKVTGRKLKGVD